MAEELPVPGGQVTVDYGKEGKSVEFHNSSQFGDAHPFVQAAQRATKERIENGKSHAETYDSNDVNDSGGATLLGDATPEQVKRSEQTYITQQTIALAALSSHAVIGAAIPKGTPPPQLSALPKVQANKAKGDQQLRRPYIRKQVRAEVKLRAPKTSDGKFIDPNTGEVIEGNYDLGHKTGNEFRTEKAKAQAEGLTQKEFNDRMNNADLYQIKSPSANRSHKYEMENK